MRILLTTLHSRYTHASLALPYLAAYCRPLRASISIRELNVNQPKEHLLAQIVACDADIVCFSVYLWNRLTTLELVCCLKQVKPRVKIVLGGPEISYESDEFFDRYPVDAVICGEGEIPLRHLLQAWCSGRPPAPIAGLRIPDHPGPTAENQLQCLDELPSPFALGLVDLTRGLVYYESSRGCPYRCSFCLSALSDTVRSFSMNRIRSDLDLLMQKRVRMIKFVDRTFNYDAARARDIFSYILDNNRSSSFHFEIGAHLLDPVTITLLERVPPGMFQFEIGIQSTLPETLKKVSRKVPLNLVADNVRALRQRTSIHLHLDLVAGLPGESLPQFLDSVDRTFDLGADHLQIELVKLLPGTPLRAQAEQLRISYDAAPPYTVLQTAAVSFHELERIRGIGRLNDLLINSHKFIRLVEKLIAVFGTVSAFLQDLDKYWRRHRLYAESRSLRDLSNELDAYLCSSFAGDTLQSLRECLGRDYAHGERVVGGSAPVFFNVDVSAAERVRVAERVRNELEGLARSGKVQFFSAVFEHLPEAPGRRILIFLYVSRTAQGMQVKELLL